MYLDGDPPDPNAQDKLDYSKTFAFTNFKIYTNPYIYAKSDIDVTMTRPQIREEDDYFALFEFSAKWDQYLLCFAKTMRDNKGIYGTSYSI